MRLSDAQHAAVSHPNSIALIACPGSGKTQTLVAKLIKEVDEIGDSTRLLACITYTNAAVHEIESRLNATLSSGRNLCEVETIHSFCLKHIVVPHHWNLSVFRTGFSVLAFDDPRFSEIVAEVVTSFGLDKKAAEDFENLARGANVYPSRITREAAAAYWAALDARFLMDFSSIIYWSAQLIQQVPYLARGLASRYQWILVDEFQDTSLLQVKILRAIHAHGRTKVFIVGDPFQSIMSVNGATPDLLASFGEEIKARRDIELMENYRSSAPILRLADTLCERPSPMVAHGINGQYAHVPEWYAVADMLSGITDIFVPALAQHGIKLSSSAILANRWTSLLPLSRGLRDRRIPAIGPGTRPYKRSSHIIAPLVESLAAYSTERAPTGVARIRRDLQRLIQDTTKGSGRTFGFLGDVCAERLIRLAARLGAAAPSAAMFLREIGDGIANEILRAELAPRTACELVRESSKAMWADIVKHESAYKLRTTTVQDLGLFAYGSTSLQLLTMHGSKGREYDAVALVDVFDGHVPFFTCSPGDATEAEGRRLLYVAITRARKLLMMFTLAQSKEKPSRFLKELFPNGPHRRP